VCAAAPYGTLSEGDVVAVKKTGGPVCGAFQAGTVRSYQLTPGRVIELRGQFAAQICAYDDEFWAQRADCAYATQERPPRLGPAHPARPPGHAAMNSVTPAVVAIAGPIGSGKTTTAALLAGQLAWPKAGYGDTIRAIAAGRGLPASRVSLQRLGLDLTSSGWDAFTGARWVPGQPLILDGLRHPPAVRDHADLIITAERLTPPQVTGQIASYLESALGHAPGGRCA
jgi:hypothetical protein